VHRELELALHLADRADAITLPRFRGTDLVVELKADSSPVTDVDRLVEQEMRTQIAHERPGDVVVGEEFGVAEGRRRWIVDPIDGTKNFMRGIPIWATLLALEVEGQVEVGVVSAPALGRRWWAARGEGAYADGEPITVSGVSSVDRAVVLYTSVPSLERTGHGERFRALARRCWAARGFGDFWALALVAEGAADIAVQAELALWDVAAPTIVVEEAGGRITQVGESGSPSTLYVATNGVLHDEAVDAMTAD
jgi:histidinol-phosphatase